MDGKSQKRECWLLKEVIKINIGSFDLEFKLKKHGGYIYDVRDKKKPRFVGLIMETTAAKGYTLCPFVRRSIHFDAAVPDNLRSPLKAQHWVMDHAVMWNATRRYTVFNGIIGILVPIPRVLHVLRDVRSAIIVLQLFFAVILYQRNPNNLLEWSAVIIAASWAIYNIVILCKDHRIFSRRF